MHDPDPVRTDSATGDDDDLGRQFDQAVAALNAGDLTGGYPFDYGTTVRLAGGGRVHYRIRVHAVAPDSPDVADREIVDTTTLGPHAAVMLLVDAARQILATQTHRFTPRKETPQ